MSDNGCFDSVIQPHHLPWLTSISTMYAAPLCVDSLDAYRITKVLLNTDFGNNQIVRSAAKVIFFDISSVTALPIISFVIVLPFGQ